MNKLSKTLKILIAAAAAVVLIAVIIIPILIFRGKTKSAPTQASREIAESVENREEPAEAVQATEDPILNETDLKKIILSDKDQKAKITVPGKYLVEGKLTEGKLTVDCTGDVTLVLNGVQITNSEDAALKIKSAKTVTIHLAEGSVNTLTSGEKPEIMTVSEEASGAALRAKCDLIIEGEGTLNVNGYINNGISSSENITILGGTLQVEAVNNGIKASKTLTVDDGLLYVTAGNMTALAPMGIGKPGEMGNPGKMDKPNDMGKPMDMGKPGKENNSEGLEGASVVINGGELHISASDDGINASSKTSKLPELKITGGLIYINALGDGIDSNGDLIFEGGEIYVDGPSDNGNAALDSGKEDGGKLLITGGTVLAIGSSGMAEKFGPDSTQVSFLKNLAKTYEAGTEIVLKNKKGDVLLEHTSEKSFNSIAVSFPEMKAGEEYTLVLGTETISVTP